MHCRPWKAEECGVHSVGSEESGVLSGLMYTHSVKWVLWSVWSVKCKVCSGKRGVECRVWSVKCQV